MIAGPSEANKIEEKKASIGDKVISAAVQTVVSGGIMYYFPQAYPQLLCSNILIGLGLVPENPIAKLVTMGSASYATHAYVAPLLPALDTVAKQQGNLAYPVAALSLPVINEGAKLISAGARRGLTWAFDKKSKEQPHTAPLNEMSEQQLAEMPYDMGLDGGDNGEDLVAQTTSNAEEAPAAVELRRSDRLKDKPRVDYKRQMMR